MLYTHIRGGFYFIERLYVNFICDEKTVFIDTIDFTYLSCEDKKDDEDTTLIPSTNPTEVTLWGVDYSVKDTYTLDLSDNQLCPPYPSCIVYVGD